MYYADGQNAICCMGGHNSETGEISCVRGNYILITGPYLIAQDCPLMRFRCTRCLSTLSFLNFTRRLNFMLPSFMSPKNTGFFRQQKFDIYWFTFRALIPLAIFFKRDCAIDTQLFTYCAIHFKLVLLGYFISEIPLGVIAVHNPAFSLVSIVAVWSIMRMLKTLPAINS